MNFFEWLRHEHKFEYVAVWNVRPNENDFGGKEWDGAYVKMCLGCGKLQFGDMDYHELYRGEPSALFSRCDKNDVPNRIWFPLKEFRERLK